jgi:arginyl-tRNA synthetase
MSSRKGNIITGEALIEDVQKLVLEKIKDREFSDEDPSIDSGQVKNEIAEEVAIGAIKYSILRQAIGGDIIFDFEKSISFEGDSGPYLQYTAVRANSVLANFKNLTPDPSPKSRRGGEERPEVFEIQELERFLYRFPEVVERAGKEYAPHHLVTYLTELASLFNSFYAKEKIIDESDPSSPYKIAMTQAVAHTLQNGLHLLGIKVPRRM